MDNKNIFQIYLLCMIYLCQIEMLFCFVLSLSLFCILNFSFRSNLCLNFNLFHFSICFISQSFPFPLFFYLLSLPYIAPTTLFSLLMEYLCERIGELGHSDILPHGFWYTTYVVSGRVTASWRRSGSLTHEGRSQHWYRCPVTIWGKSCSHTRPTPYYVSATNNYCNSRSLITKFTKIRL